MFVKQNASESGFVCVNIVRGGIFVFCSLGHLILEAYGSNLGWEPDYPDLAISPYQYFQTNAGIVYRLGHDHFHSNPF
jgi:hypothetical protein